MIILPNKFSCVGRSLLLSLDETVDFEQLSADGMPAELREQLRSNVLVVTFTDAVSEVHPGTSISYREILFKLPVTVDGVPLLHPVVTYVDSEYSLIRGYFLGFHKRWISGGSQNVFEQDGSRLQIGGVRSGTKVDAAPLAEILRRPMVLHRNFSFDPSMTKNGWAVLDAEDLLEKATYELVADWPDQQILGVRATVVDAAEVHEEFVLRGVKELSSRREMTSPN
jgi:hypothetical protein